MRGVALRQFPIQHDNAGHKSDIAVVEIVMRQRAGQCVLGPMPSIHGIDQPVPPAFDLFRYDAWKSRMGVIQ